MRKHKYNARRVQIDGIWFDSTAEGERYKELELLEKAGVITDLRVHPKYQIRIEGVLIGEYEADFFYYGLSLLPYVEDVKGVRTGLYRWKKACFLALYGPSVHFREIKVGEQGRKPKRAKTANAVRGKAKIANALDALGILPMKPGDELPETRIRRQRGGV